MTQMKINVLLVVFVIMFQGSTSVNNANPNNIELRLETKATRNIENATDFSVKDSCSQIKDVFIWRDLTYFKENGIELHLNLYKSKESPRETQLIVLLHGERMKSKENFGCLARNLAASGFTVASIEYRMPPDYSYPKALDDVLAAIDWIQSNSKNYGIAINSVGLVGQNFGGYLATLVGLKNPKEIQGIVAIHSPMDLTAYTDNSGSTYPYRYHVFLGFPFAQNPELWKAASPIHLVTMNSPPILMIHGKSDKRVPFKQSNDMYDAIKAAGGNARLYSVNEAENGYFITDPGLNQTVEVLKRFFKYNLSLLEEVEVKKDIIYASSNGRDLHLDIFKPKEVEGPLPVVIYVHGGGWLWGQKENMWEEAAELASNGYITATVEYRLAKERIYPAAIDDIKAAVRWLRANSVEFGIQPDRIGAVGRSAGGHLVSLLGVTPEMKYFGELIGPPDPSAAVQSVVTYSGAVDLVGVYSRDPLSPTAFLGYSLIEAPDLFEKASPINLVSSNSSNFLFIHGTKDHLGTHKEVVSMAAKLQSFGIKGEVYSIKDGGHDFETNEQWRYEAMQALISFFEETLKDYKR